jgi:GR25 family glycosyltransferase involved in LPS biosynthesis
MKKPILFLIFNRPDLTHQVFEVIRLYKPNKLYIAADGPRKNKSSDIQLCEESRKIVNNINWDCDVRTLFSNENIGCKMNVSNGINWFFENEEDGIILEDDVVPNIDFFNFCEYCLNKYAEDTRIMMITGTNYLSNENLDSTYFYSKHFSIWGWATWKRSWEYYDINMQKWNDPKVKLDIKYMFNGNYIWKHFKNTFDSLKSFNIDTWDIQWIFSCVINNGYCITPRVNLISNIGINGTHSNKVTDSLFLTKYLLSNSSDYKSPSNFLVNSYYDKNLHLLKSKKSNRRYSFLIFLKFLNLYEILKKIKNKLK